jgi:hypothetical protein
MTPEPDGVAVNLAAALNEERRRRREAEAWAERFYRLLRADPHPWETVYDYEDWKRRQS